MPEPHRHTHLAKLDLVCAPLPSSAASALAKNTIAEAEFRKSDFYMIVGRACASFVDFPADASDGCLHVSIEVAGGLKGRGYIDLAKIHAVAVLSETDEIDLIFDSEFISVFRITDSQNQELIAALEPNEVLLERGRGNPMVVGFDNFLELAAFDLLYVGIASKGDTFDRLIAKGHKARQDILSLEPARYPGARVSDEVYLLPFKIEALQVSVYSPEMEVAEEDMNFESQGKRVVKDAEKAYISLLKPPYNIELYPNYPQGVGGMYGERFAAYSYTINEGVAFRTAYGTIKGAHDRSGLPSNNADFILVEGEAVTFHISGKDFAAD